MICAPACIYDWCTRKTASGSGAVQLIKTALRPHGFMQQRTHRSIGNENRVLQPFIEFLNLQLAFPVS